MAPHKNSATTGGKQKFTLFQPTTMANRKKAKDASGNVPLPPATRSTRSKTRAAPETVDSVNAESVEPVENSAGSDGMFLL